MRSDPKSDAWLFETDYLIAYEEVVGGLSINEVSCLYKTPPPN